MKANADNQTFWEHLDALRSALLKSLMVAMVFTVVAFCFKETLFAIILAPQSPQFVTYRWLAGVSRWVDDGGDLNFNVHLISTGLAEQFMIHMQTSLYAGIICASPYILYQLYRFVSPALYANERQYAFRVVGGAYMMFALGIVVNYFLLFPLTFRFLGDYHVSPNVENMVTLQSYISSMLTMSLALGVVFEIPILSWLFAKLGFLTAPFMRHYRRHAIVIILIVAAVITPTSDVFTLSLVALPMWVLYEMSIFIVKRTQKRYK